MKQVTKKKILQHFGEQFSKFSKQEALHAGGLYLQSLIAILLYDKPLKHCLLSAKHHRYQGGMTHYSIKN